MDFNFNIAIQSCDERIESMNQRILQYKTTRMMVRLVISKDDTKYDLLIQNLEQDIKIVKTEKLIYQTFLKKNKRMFQLLLEKYRENMIESFDISGNLVKAGTIKEEEYRQYTFESKKQQEYIKLICKFGEDTI